MKHLAQRGISIVEALVALAIMAFGMLGLVGMQGSMRLNADVAKQRSEAVRIAQEQIEAWRSYTGLDEYRDEIVAIAETAASAPNSTNTTYTIVATMAPGPTDPPTTPPLKTTVVTVNWSDRASAPQSVTLTTRIAAQDPVLGGALSAPSSGGPSRRPLGRNVAIPPGAVGQGDGTSRFVPPGGDNIGWVFNNTTGLIIKLCESDFSNCTDVNLMLLTGFVRYSHIGLPTPAESESPTDLDFPSGIRVQVDLTEPTGSVECAVSQNVAFAVYYCALPLTATNPPRWSGRSTLSGFNIASSPSTTDRDRFRVCRYTTQRSNTPSGGNLAHPLDYSEVTTALLNQNFLIIRAGNRDDDDDRDGIRYDCPDDDTSTPYVNGRTYDHQPPIIN